MINIPQAQININNEKGLPLLLVGGGRAPARSWLRTAAAGRSIWCIDHGIDCCHAAGIVPERFIGDGDSSSAGAREWAKNHSAGFFTFPPEKDLTDTQLTLKMLPPDASVVLTGAFGKRFDHAFSTIYSFAHTGISGLLADEQEMLIPIHPHSGISVKFLSPPEAVSLLPLTAECTGVSLSGVKWPLTAAVLPAALPYAVSNELKNADTVSVSVNNGIIGFYACWRV